MDAGWAYEFGPYRLEVAARRLLRDGDPVSLTPKAFDILQALIERRDRVVDKTELMQLVWPDSFVEEANLSQTIFVLRKTLGGSDVNGRQYIHTVPRRGYRFAANVRTNAGILLEREAADASQLGPPQAAIDPADAPSGVEHPLRSWRRSVSGRVVAGLALATLAVLTWVGASRARLWGSSANIESLVVLPLENLSGDELDYFAEGMTDALIMNLGQISGLRVISRTSAVTYRGTHKTLPEIARELGVDAVVEGTVQRANGRVRLNLKLIEAPTDRLVWGQTYERDLRDAVDLQNETARTIASRIGVTLTARERSRLNEAPGVNPKAYEAYLKGRYFWNRRSEPDVRQAIEHFEEALRHDSQYAPAWAGLADSYTLFGTYGWTVPADREWARAIDAANKAVALDESLADGYTSRAGIAMNYELDWAKAGDGYRRALELNPGYANAHHWYGYYLMLMGRVKEAEAEMRRALELDPLSPIINANIGFCFYVSRQYDAALAHWRRALEMHRNYRLLHGYMTVAYAGKGMYPEAVAELQKGLGLSGAGPSETAVLAHLYGRMGRTEDARMLLSQLLERSREKPVPAYYIAIVYVGLGETDDAFKWLEKAYQERSGPFNELNADPMFDPLRTDPRFKALVHRMGLSMSAAPLPN